MRYAFAVLLVFLLPRFAGAVEILAAAVSGEPYGVATIEIPLEIPIVGDPLPQLEVSDSQHRVLYPVADDLRTKTVRPSEQPVPEPGRGRLLGRLGNLIREIASTDDELEQTVSRRVMFLFHGEAPLNVTVRDNRRILGEYEIATTRDPAELGRQLNQWWSRYTNFARAQIEAADYPPWVETYLVAMLSGRLNLPLPDWYSQANDDDKLVDTMKLIAGAEKINDQVFRQAAVGTANPTQAAALPLPPPPDWKPSPSDLLRDNASLAAVAIEPIAQRVPPECFYIRYGSFANYMWFRDLSSEYGGDISRMVTLRGVKDDSAARIESQLHLQTTELTRMIGPSVIEDQAVVGRDLYVADGASIGVMFKASQPFLLRTSLQNERALLARTDESVSLTEESIGTHKVSLLHSPDNRVRSFLVEDDGFFFVTNSRALVRRFLEVGDGAPSLASTTSFKLARQLMPLERQDTLFAYFSPEMLQGLVSPEYLIELRRRMFAKSDIAMVHLARLASTTEGEPRETPADLVQAGFLPHHFGSRSDGSGTITVGKNVLDSSRGRRSTFLPISDSDMQSVSDDEAQWYQQIASQYTTRFAQIDPIMIGVKRESFAELPGIERLTVHAEIAPWVPEKYGKYSQYLGPPTQVAMQFAPDDIVAVQAHVAAEALGPPTHLFAAIKDTVPPHPEAFDGMIKSYLALRNVPGYLGAWPQPGALDRLPLGIGRGQPVGPGMTRLITGLYRYTGGGFSILAFDPAVLQASIPHIAAVDVVDSAQVRLHVGNLVGSQLEDYVNGLLYSRADDTSSAGAAFLDLMTRQLNVSPEQALAAADDILGGQLQCSLGGEYIYRADLGHWTTTAYQGALAPGQVPPGYVAPLMVWFRGMDATLTQYPDRLVTDAVIDVARQPAP